ncbi:MAG TPA: aliphatic sulfonate ABC transporter substrate-binding protein, partial [Chthoniobacterales bacterium]|nr:aliphatic sulfonate ABC transporter substrate-binding protein [Chthoniobacterales bacterium]
SKVVRVGYQKSGALLLTKSSGLLEKALAPLGYSVVWKEFPSGLPLLEALNGGSIDIGHSGDAPLLFAQAAGIPFQIFAASNPSPESTGVVVPKDSPIHSFAELKGKTVAFARGSSSHLVVAQLLAREGLTFADIKPVYLEPPDARAAFEAKAIDGWAVWDPFLAAAEVEGGARLIVNGAGIGGHREFYFGRAEFLQANPKVVDLIMAVLSDTGKAAKHDPKATADFLAEKLGISPAVMERSELRKQRYFAQAISTEIVNEQQAGADIFFRLGLMPKAIRVGDIVYASHTSAP